MSAVISVRVRRELKLEAERLGVNVREVVERALEEAVREAKRKRILSLLREMGRLASGLGEEEWVEIVREVRRERVGKVSS